MGCGSIAPNCVLSLSNTLQQLCLAISSLFFTSWMNVLCICPLHIAFIFVMWENEIINFHSLQCVFFSALLLLLLSLAETDGYNEHRMIWFLILRELF